MFLPTLPPSASALVRSQQAGPHAGAWLTAVPIDPATALQPHAMQLALRRRLRLPLHLSSRRCGPSPGCGAQVDAFGDHTLACPRTGLSARRAKILERAWVRVARKAVGADGQVVPQQWLAHTTAPNVDPADRRKLDLVIYGATPLGGALCCDATLVSPLTRTGQHRAQRRQTAQRSGWQSDASAPRTRSSACEARSGWWSWAQRSGAVGMRERCASCAIWSGSGPSAPRPPSELLPGPPGREGGGPSWQSQCSRPLLPQHWAIRGWCRLAPARRMAPSWTRFSTWPSRRDPADCRCGREAPTKTHAADAKKKFPASLGGLGMVSAMFLPRERHVTACWGLGGGVRLCILHFRMHQTMQ